MQMIQQREKLRKQLEKQKKEVEKAKAHMNAKDGSVDMTAIEPVEADFKIQMAANEKKEVADDAE